MSRVDFYVLGGADPKGKLMFTSRLAGKIHRLGQRAYIHAQDERQAKLLDDLLWTFDQSTFVPHEISDQAADRPPQTPVVIGIRAPCEFQYDVLISLVEDEIPDYWQKFPRIAEIVVADPEDKQRARERFRQYRERGLKVDTHEINV